MTFLKITTLIDDEKLISFDDIKNYRVNPTGNQNKLVEYWVELRDGKIVHGIGKKALIVREE